MSLLNGGNGGCGCAGSCSGGAAPEGDALNGAAANGANGTGTSRRRFLKVLGTSGAGAATLAACGPPDFGDKLIPSLVEEEGITPGVSDTYATVLPDAGPEPVAVHAQVRDGRVLGLSPNDRFGGGTNGLSSLTHSTLQDLYDPDRVSQPIQRNPSTEEGAPPFQFANWDDATAALTNAVRVGGAVLLTGRVTGTTGRFIAEWARVMGVEHIAWEPFSNQALAGGTADVSGGAGMPRFDLSSADRVACFGADFLGTWLAPTQMSAGFAAARDIDAHHHAKFTFVGPRLSLTGANADEWIEARAGTEGAVALAVAGVVAAARGVTLPAGVSAVSPEAVADAAGISADAIRALGEELAAAENAVAIPPGIESQGAAARQAHQAVAALNEVLGAVGTRVFPGGGAPEGTTASFVDMQALMGRMRAGQVRTLIVSGCNPAYALPAAAGFGEALANVANTVAITPHLDETASACGWVLPCHHALESWCDADLADGAMALGQPLMHPVFDTRQREDLLLDVANAAGQGAAFGGADYATVLRSTWTERLGGDDAWLDALRRGGASAAAWAGDEGEGSGADSGADPAPAGGVDGFAAPQAPDGTQLVVYPTAQFYDGRGANRSWMQEQPDAITKVVWNSWVEMHPDMADELGVERGDVVRVESAQGAIEAPVYVYRGIRPDTVAIPLGQGHTEYGRYARNRGVNPLDLLAANADPGSGALAYAGTAVTVEATGETARLVVTQGSTDDQDREIVHAMNVEDALHEVEAHEIDLVELVEAAWDSDPNSPYRWGMTIDLNACTGCGACVTSCYSENNIPTVGEEQAALRREMSWMRIHRFEEEAEDGGFQTVQQPMLCQHCGDAPCEPVCPVYATYHSPEGLNVQVYNRCVGTRYCANNCPYKVRRFNWFNHDARGRGDGGAFAWPLNLQLNPDITVREVGVMEKCTMCVHRINKAKIDAKEEGRTVRDGEVMTACQASCPSNAITFGNLKDPGSEVSRKAKSARGYHALGELGVRPAITYLEDVTHRHMPAGGHGEDEEAH
ncbi:MAG: 4Fe-4S dicluster domain-containing protein [Gemmatimonadota bacterium]|uniref:molybdopterin dinucleotide binding domain-containing protein n=1 Tax=Candidatus Palauibacter scopulicola TaxID=3056741 RepID=UPI00238E39B8|nr:molybdopterin dinucleotide binding domain-containing protein [Candidatus Palauibacter scopulicola]MDE2662645.1 4Fe-4S dicluster domain-containing protein [Candidatus Palauibacter scopulicola]